MERCGFIVSSFALAATLGGCSVKPRNPEASPAGYPASPHAIPQPRQIPHRMELHGDVRIDPFYWMRERENPEVLAHLQAENDYFLQVMAPHQALQAQLQREMRDRLVPEDSSYPYQKGAFEYWLEYPKLAEHPEVWRRTHGSEERHLLIDANDLARGQTYFQLVATTASPDGNYLAYAVDRQGRGQMEITVVDLRSGKALATVLTNTSGMAAWHPNGESLFFTRLNPTTLRPEKLEEFVLLDQSTRVVYAEKDESFNLSVSTSRRNRFVFLEIASTDTTEVRYLDAGGRKGKAPSGWKLFSRRRRGHEYQVEDMGSSFAVLSNRGAKNFQLWETPYSATAPSNWRLRIPHRKSVLIEAFLAFPQHVATFEQEKGQNYLTIWDKKNWTGRRVEFGEPVYSLHPEANREFDLTSVRVSYSSPTTPQTIYDVKLQSREPVLRKRTQVLGGFSPDNYVTSREWIPSRDGKTRVPVILTHRRDLKWTPNTPLLINGYGAYGMTYPPYFNANELSLLDRGVVVATAQVRGGSELGRKWYEDGRLAKKMNTFYDFIDVAQHFHTSGRSSPKHTVARGGSAGGLLMGAVLNLRPDLFRAIVAEVPFVDVLTTMLDPSLPLTVGEYTEWGNPNLKSDYMVMRKYSPMDNIPTTKLPAVMATGGLHDHAVQYFEPAKWVARLRLHQKGPAPILLWTELSAGHGGKSGRYAELEDEARVQAFVLSHTR